MGASQVLPYVERLAARGTDVTLHTFEHQRPNASLAGRLEAAGVDWHPHRFRWGGARGGLARVITGASLIRGASLVHARSDLPAASALLARSPAWVWDVRSFWADQRITMGTLTAGSPEHRVLQGVEAASARRAAAVVTLTAAAVDVLARRHGEAIREIATVIPTCVDTDRFTLAPMPATPRLQLVLSGSFNSLYDLHTSLALVAALQQRRPAELTFIRPGPSPWDDPVIQAGGVIQSAPFSLMPERLRASHAGLSILRADGSDALAACAPTKLAEFLATGRPVVVSPGLGDMDQLLARHQCGVVVADRSAAGLALAAEELGALVDDPATPGRCRALAIEHFDLDAGVTKLVEAYRMARQRTRSPV